MRMGSAIGSLPVLAGLVDHEEDGALFDLLAGDDMDGGDDAVGRGPHVVLHLHGFEHEHGLAGAHAIPGGDAHLEHDAGHAGHEAAVHVTAARRDEAGHDGELHRPALELDVEAITGARHGVRGPPAVDLDVDGVGAPAVHARYAVLHDERAVAL